MKVAIVVHAEAESCDRRCFPGNQSIVYILVVCKTNGLLNLHCCTTETHPRVLQCNSCKWDTPGNLWDLFHRAQTLRKSIFIFVRFKKATVQCWFWFILQRNFVLPPLVNSGSSQMNLLPLVSTLCHFYRFAILKIHLIILIHWF